MSECKRFEFSRAGEGRGGIRIPLTPSFRIMHTTIMKTIFFRIQTLWFSFIFHIEEILYSSLACAETDNDEIYM